MSRTPWHDSPSSDGLISYYAALAPHYDERPRTPARIADVRILQGLCEREFSGLDILELACGTGEWTEHMSRFASSVVAVDANLEMLKIACARCSNSSAVQLICGDAYAPPVRDSSFTAGFAGWWLSHVPKRAMMEFLIGFHLKLKPHAVVILADDTPAVAERLIGPDYRGDTRALRTLEDGRCFHIVKNLYEEAELRKILEPFATSILYVEGSCHWFLRYVICPARWPSWDPMRTGICQECRTAAER